MNIIAYQYGLLAPLDWDEDCREQLYRMNRLWNTLVEIERKHREQVRSVIGDDDAVKPLQAQLDALREEQAALREERKLRRQKARARIETADIDARLKQLSALIQPLATQTKETRRAAVERVRAPLQALDELRKAAVKTARQPVQSGLYWGNYNAVVASYQSARSKAMRDGAELRFRRFTGEGRFVVQIINGASVDEIMSGVKQVSLDKSLQPIPGRGGQPLPRLIITIYTRDGAPRTLTFPIIYDRPLPEECRVQEVVVTRRRCATHWQYAAVFTCRIERPMVSTINERSCALNLGFRQVPGDRPGRMALKVVTIFNGEQHETLEIPSRWMSRMDDVERIQQQRDDGLNEVVAVLRSGWQERPQEFRGCEELDERLGNLVRAPKFSPQKLAGIVLRWRDQHPQLWPEMRERLERWRKLDKLDVPRQGGWEIQANKRDKLILQRREIYRLFARRICSHYGLVRIGKMDLKQMARLESVDGTENELHQLARHNRQRASLYQLQTEIKLQAEKFGTRVEYIDGPVTITCHTCGGRCAVGADLMHVCEHCSSVWNQDENAAINILAAPRERSNDDGTPGQRSRGLDQSLTRAGRMRHGRDKSSNAQRSQSATQVAESAALSIGTATDRAQPGGS